MPKGKPTPPNPNRQPPVGGTGTWNPIKRVVFEFDERDKLSMEELVKRGAVLPCVLEQPMTQDEFRDHLENSSRIVATWPAWKRNVLGQCEKSTVETARPFVDNAMTQDERIEKLEREVAELRGAIDVLMGRTATLQPTGGGMPSPPLTIEGPEFKRPSPPMCDKSEWNHVPGTCGPIVPIRYPEDPPSWDIETMIEEGHKQVLTPEGELLVREAKQHELTQCHL